MALVLADRVKVRVRTTGTGSFLIENTFTGFQGFDAVGDGNETYYAIFDSIGNWEVGRGTYDVDLTDPENPVETLSRDNVIDSSLSGSKVDFPAGGKTLYVTFPSTVLNEVSTGLSDSFKFIQVSGQNTLIADSSSDSLTIVADNLINLTTDSVSDTLTISTTIPSQTGNGGKYLATDGDNLLWDNPPGGGGGNGTGDFLFYVAADDSTERQIYSGEVLQIVGSGGVTVSTDTEGKFTIDGNLTDGISGFSFDGGTSASTIGGSGNITLGTTGTIEIFGAAGSQIYIGGGSGGSTSGNVNLGNGTNSIVFASGTTGIDYNDLDNLPSIPTDTNTTYSVSAETSGANTVVRLSGSDASTDDVALVAGTGMTVTRTDANTITLASTAAAGLESRTSPNATTASLANGAAGNITIAGYKGYLLYKIQTSAAAWVRVYTSIAARTADSSRSEGVDPSPGAGVIAEVITTGAETIVISPATIGFSDESSPDTNIQLAVTNKSGGTTTITVTLTIVKLED